MLMVRKLFFFFYYILKPGYNKFKRKIKGIIGTMYLTFCVNMYRLIRNDKSRLQKNISL